VVLRRSLRVLVEVEQLELPATVTPEELDRLLGPTSDLIGRLVTCEMSGVTRT